MNCAPTRPEQPGRGAMNCAPWGWGLLSLGLGALIAALGYKRGALSVTGAAAATAVGAATFGFGGLPASLALVGFFVSGSALSRRKAVTGEVAAAKGHRRDAFQVFANGGVTAVALALNGAGWRG